MPDTTKKNYGRTVHGVAITDDLIDRYVAEAEAGLDVSKLQPLDDAQAGTPPTDPLPLHLDPELRRALDDRAASEHRPAADVVREALRNYLSAS